MGTDHFLRSRRRIRRPSRGRGIVKFAIIVGLLPALWIGQQRIEATLREPQALLVLGGSIEREQYAAKFAQTHPNLMIWVSSGSNPEYAEWVFQQSDIESSRVRLDYRAVDTVTNFTTLVDDLKAEGITSVYLVTSDYHMRRAAIIGQVVLGSRGITFRPLEVPSEEPKPEALLRSLRDGLRAVIWVLTGYNGSTLGRALGKNQIP